MITHVAKRHRSISLTSLASKLTPRWAPTGRLRAPPGPAASRPGRCWVFTAVAFASTSPACAQWVEQSFPLEAGWNTVYLEVDPAEDGADTVFVTQPPGVIERVWTWAPSNAASGPGCLDPNDPDCEPGSDTQWRLWLPPSDPASVVNSLSVARGGQVYLIKAAAVATLTVRGMPTAEKTQWQEGFNVAGFHVDGNEPPTFATYLAPSQVHAAVEIYTMNTVGELSEVVDPAAAPIDAGRGYWVLSAGTAEYDGPIAISGGSRRGLLYGKHQVEHRIDLENLAAEPRTVTLTVGPSEAPPPQPPDLPADAGMIPLKVRDYSSAEVLYELIVFDESHPIHLSMAAANPAAPQDARKLLRVSVDRQGQVEAVVPPEGAGSQYQSILTITDGAGFRRWLPISAEVPSQAGLYVGTVSVDAVAWVQADARIVLDPDEDQGYENPDWDCNRNGIADADDIASGTSQDGDGNGVPDECEGPADTTTPRPTQSPFSFPVIIHYDGDTTYTFLREVTILFAPGDETTPGRYVLGTPDCQGCAQLQAGSMIDGEPFRRRITTAAFSFEHDLPLVGGFASTLEGYTVVEADDRLNPFRHKFHPHHDGDQDGEVFTVSRTLSFDFMCSPPEGVPIRPGTGDTLLTGCYEETLGGVTSGEPPGEYIPGLHKRDINVSGRFELYRVTNIATLNDGQGGGK